MDFSIPVAYRAAGKLLEKVSSIPTRLWIAPPTRMDEHQLMQEGYYDLTFPLQG